MRVFKTFICFAISTTLTYGPVSFGVTHKEVEDQSELTPPQKIGPPNTRHKNSNKPENTPPLIKNFESNNLLSKSSSPVRPHSKLPVFVEPSIDNASVDTSAPLIQQPLKIFISQFITAIKELLTQSGIDTSYEKNEFGRVIKIKATLHHAGTKTDLLALAFNYDSQ